MSLFQEDGNGGVNFCGANPNLHPSSHTPVGMGPIGGMGPMGSGMGGGAASLSLMVSSGGSADESGTLGSMTDISADAGGGLICITEADVNSVLKDGGDDYSANEPDDFSTALEGDDYIPTNDSFSLDQFFPTVNNVREIG